MKKYDLERLDAIPIDEVVEALGGRYPKGHKPGRRQFQMHCFGPAHANGDRNPSLLIKTEQNFCKCFVCGDAVVGGPVALAKRAKGGFKEGCEWLHEAFGIPYLNEETSQTRPARKVRPPETKGPKVEYFRFDPNRPVRRYAVRDLVAGYGSLSERMRMKTVYTFVYRYSLRTDQAPKLAYHEGRGIDVAKTFELKRLGFLSPEDIDRLSRELVRRFPVEDLVAFKLFNAADSEWRPLEWKHRAKGGLVVVPNEDLYTDLVHGLKLRKVDYEGKNKEPEVSRRDLVPPVPFGIDRDVLLNRRLTLIATEGYIDGLSSGRKFFAVPGVNGIDERTLGLLEGRDVIICFDQDEAGRKGAERLKEALEKAGARAAIRTWNPALGGDLNEVKVAGNLAKVLP